MKKKSSAKWFVFFKPFLVDGYLAAATIAINLIVIFTFSTLWPFFLFICVCVLLSQQKKRPGFFILIIIIECDGVCVCGCIFSSFSAISFNSIHSFIVFFWSKHTNQKKKRRKSLLVDDDDDITLPVSVRSFLCSSLNLVSLLFVYLFLFVSLFPSSSSSLLSFYLQNIFFL